MHPDEFWMLVDARRPRKTYGSLSETDMADLHAELTDMGLLHG